MSNALLQYLRIYIIMVLRGDNVRKKFTTTLDDQLIQELKIQAIKEQTDVSKILEELIRGYLAGKQK